MTTTQQRNWIDADSQPPDASEGDLVHVARSLAERFLLEFVDLEGYDIDPVLVARFPAAVLFEHEILPLHQNGRQVTVAVSDPLKIEPLDELTTGSGFYLQTVVAPSHQIARHLREVLGVGGGTVSDLKAQAGQHGATLDAIELTSGSEEDAGASAVIRFVNDLLAEAVEQRASDIHLEPMEQQLVVRFRIDGLLSVQTVPPEIHPFRAAIISRLKIMSQLNIAEKRLPQDGRIKLTVKAREIDVRVSVIPMLDGEGIVMRLLDKSRAAMNLNSIEFPRDIDQIWRGIISRPHGLVLVTGPTGSGKTTTLYSSLMEIRSPTRKIITVEDPVEYRLNGVNQIQVQDKIGLDFAEGLRSILRHDPDVVLIGEIRDTETARSAIQASMTGHLVLSTLHTNDAPSALTRLIDLGIEPYLVSGSVEAILAQRLVRRLCVHCRERYCPDCQTRRVHQLPDDRPLYRAVGCRECRGTGYSGRVGIFELMTMNVRLRDLCSRKAPIDEIRSAALASGMLTLTNSGVRRAVDGQTSIEEVVRVCAG